MSETANIQAELAEIIHEIAGTAPDRIVAEADLTKDLQLDSLSMVEIVVAAEERFEVRIPDSKVADLTTVADAVAFIESARVGAGQSA